MSAFHVFIICLMVQLILASNASFHPENHSHGDSLSAPQRPVQEAKLAYSKGKNMKLIASGKCTNRDISISQNKDSTPGIPRYVVQIVNTCMSGCAPSNIHLHCGWFASARIVNPRTFKRLSYDDCLVNGGSPLKSSQIIRFTYSNSFMYPLALKSARFC